MERQPVAACRSTMSRNARNDIKRTDSGDGILRRTTRSLSPLPPRRLTDDNGNAPAPKRAGTSLRKFTKEIKHCSDLDGIESNVMCSGCSLWNDSKKLKPREELKTRECQCLQAWTIDEKNVERRHQKHCKAIASCIETAHDVQKNLLVIPIETTTTPAQPTTTTTTTEAATVTPPETEIRMELNKFQSCGKEHECWTPHTHKIVHCDHNKRIENDSAQLAKVVHKLQSSRFSAHSVFSQTLFSLAMSAAPALALSAAQRLTPLCFMAFICDTELCRHIDINKFVASFPSNWLLRKCVHHQATRDAISVGRKLHGKRLHLSCDKGNKRGVSHFIKLLSSWNPTGRVDVQVLDTDGSGGATLECANATQASINKLKINDDDDTHLLAGQSTDSGGGGVLEKLAEEMQGLGLCWLQNHLVTNCCMHGLQLQLSNGIKAALGEGGLDNVNVMQMLHSACRLQESMDLEEWHHVLHLSSQFVVGFDPAAAPEAAPEVAEDDDELIEDNNKRKRKNKKKKKQTKEELAASCKVAFMVDCECVNDFHPSFKKNTETDPSNLAKHEGAIFMKMVAPVLTRWWTVGSGASCVFDCCLQLLYACQTVINICPSGSAPNDSASDLFAMMKDQNNFVDMCLVRTFNKNCLNVHLVWFQARSH